MADYKRRIGKLEDALGLNTSETNVTNIWVEFINPGNMECSGVYVGGQMFNRLSDESEQDMRERARLVVGATIS